MSCTIIPQEHSKEKEIAEDEKYLHLLPNTEELINYIKFSILTCIQDNNDLLTTNEFGAHVEVDRIRNIYKKSLTDIELLAQVMGSIRIYLVPIEDVRSIPRQEHPQYHFRFWYGYGEVNGSWSTPYPVDYDFMQEDFISWLRKLFESPKAECALDDEILKESMQNVFNHMLWWGKDEYNLSERIKSFKNHKDFKSDVSKFLKENNIDSNGGGCGQMRDTFSSNYTADFNHVSLVINMDKKYREQIGRDCDYSLEQSYPPDENRIAVFNLKKDEFWKEAFRVYKGIEPQATQPKQLSLFDFL